MGIYTTVFLYHIQSHTHPVGIPARQKTLSSYRFNIALTPVSSMICVQAAAALARQVFAFRRQQQPRAALHPTIIECGANANTHIQALSAGRYHGCLGVCSGCCAGATTSSRDDAQRRLRAACAETAAAEHLTTGASTAVALRYSAIYCKARSKRRTWL